MHLLKVPAVFSGLRVHRDDRRREQVVALAEHAVVVRARVAGAEIKQAELGIDGWGIPDRRAAVLPEVVVGRPGVVAGLARSGHRVERPRELAAVRLERFHSTANAAFAAGERHDHETVVVQRRGRDREALLPAFRLNRPRDVTRALIERDELAVELADVHAAVAERHAAARPAAAHRVVLRVEIRAVVATRPRRCRPTARTRRRRPSRGRSRRRRRAAALRPSTVGRGPSRRRWLRQTPLSFPTLPRSISCSGE